MKHHILLLMTASALLAGGFDVPFAFHNAGQVMPAGRYEINAVPETSSVYRIENHAARKSVLVSFPRHLTARDAEQAWVVFQCMQIPCKIAGVVSGAGLEAARNDWKNHLVLVPAGK